MYINNNAGVRVDSTKNDYRLRSIIFGNVTVSLEFMHKASTCTSLDVNNLSHILFLARYIGNLEGLVSSEER